MEEEAEKELSGKRAERESFRVILKEGTFLSEDGEKDISKDII